MVLHPPLYIKTNINTSILVVVVVIIVKMDKPPTRKKRMRAWKKGIFFILASCFSLFFILMVTHNNFLQTSTLLQRKYNKNKSEKKIKPRPWSILIIGDSQERRVVGQFCSQSEHDPGLSPLTVKHFLNNTRTLVPLFPQYTKLSKNSWCCQAKFQDDRDVLICNFFTFGSVLQEEVFEMGEENPYEFNRRIDMIPDLFSSMLNGSHWDLVSAHSGLWDIMRFIKYKHQNVSYSETSFLQDYSTEFVSLHYNKLHHLLHQQPRERLVWRTLPPDFSNRYSRSTIDSINKVLLRLGQQHSVSINDWGARMRNKPTWARFGWHFNKQGSQLYYEWLFAYLDCLEQQHSEATTKNRGDCASHAEVESFRNTNHTS